jgi:GNAT superfamily N-acetyltransferase
MKLSMSIEDHEIEILIRTMKAADAGAVSLLVEQLGYQRSPDAIRSWMEGLNANAEMQAAFVACVEKQVVGWIEVSIQNRLQSPRFTLIGGLVVREESRGKGVGQMLCERAERWSLERNVKIIRLTSRQTRQDAHRFYLRAGYRLTKTSLAFEKILAE